MLGIFNKHHNSPLPCQCSEIRNYCKQYDNLFAEFFFESEFAFEILTEQKINTLRIGFVDIILLV